MSGRLEGKKIIVTAAGQGIGKATAIAFHNEGASVSATDLNDKTLADLNKEYPEIKVQKLDSTDNTAILEFCPKLGKICKIIPKMLQISGNLAKLSQKCSKFSLFVKFY